MNPTQEDLIMGMTQTMKIAMTLLISLLLAILIAHTGWAEDAITRTAAPAEAKAYIISPERDAVVSSPVTVRFGLKGMGVAPAGVTKDATGHHHLIIDANFPDATKPIPNDDQHRHFGGGQTETSLELTPGTHSLQLVLGDANHVPHLPPVFSIPISITVK